MSHRLRTPRLVATGLALSAALTLSACSDIPDITISTDQLEQLAADAKAQVSTITADAQELADRAGTLSDDARAKAEEAVAAAKDGSAKAQTALENAGVSGEDASREVAEAEKSLDTATTRLTELKDSLGDVPAPDVVASIDALQAQVDSLRQKIVDATS